MNKRKYKNYGKKKIEKLNDRKYSLDNCSDYEDESGIFSF